MKKIFPLTITLMLLMASCKKDSGPYIIIPKNVPVHQVSFSKEIQPIFDNNCVSCHDQNHFTGEDLRPGVSYAKMVNVVSYGYAPAVRVKPFSADSSVLWNKDAGTGKYGQQMPPGGFIQQFEMDLIKTWINQGAKNN